MNEVNRTAYGVARVRARESARSDPLFADPYAAILSAGSEVEPAVTQAAREQRRRLVAHVTVRTRFYDDLLLAADLDQVVVLGAGLDARAWRLPWRDGTVVWELDQAPALARKAQVLAAPQVDRRAVVIDLRDDWPAVLAAAGHDATRPTAWLAEGLLAYLDPPVAHALLDAVTAASAAGSVLGCEEGTTQRRVPGTVSALWRGGLPDGASAALGQRGWEAEVFAATDLAESYGRPELAVGGSLLVRAELLAVSARSARAG